MTKWFLWVLPALCLTSCVSFHLGNRMGLESTELGTQSRYECTVKAAVELVIAEAFFPATYPAKPAQGQKPGNFDPNRFFTILKHISMEPGYSLEYIYVIDRDVGGYAMGGEPSLCALPTGEQATGNSSSGLKSSGVPSNVLEHLMTDGTPDSYFELAILHILGNEFYIFWHALPGKDVVPIGGKNTLENLLTPLGIAWIRIFGPAVEPTVVLESDTVTVSLMTFSDWRGIARRTFVFRRNFPHVLVVEKAKYLLCYNRYWGIRF